MDIPPHFQVFKRVQGLGSLNPKPFKASDGVSFPKKCRVCKIQKIWGFWVTWAFFCFSFRDLKVTYPPFSSVLNMMVQKNFPTLSPFERYGGFDFYSSWLTFSIFSQKFSSLDSAVHKVAWGSCKAKKVPLWTCSLKV